MSDNIAKLFEVAMDYERRLQLAAQVLKIYDETEAMAPEVCLEQLRDALQLSKKAKP